MDKTVFSFDLPDNRVITIGRLIPLPQRDDVVELNGEVHTVRSAALEIDSKAGDVVIHVRLR